MIYKRAIFKVKKEFIPRAKKAIRLFVKEIQQHEPGTEIYESYQLDDKVTFIHYMAFKNSKAENKHCTAQYTKNFVHMLHPLCMKQPKFNKLFLVAKK